MGARTPYRGRRRQQLSGPGTARCDASQVLCRHPFATDAALYDSAPQRAPGTIGRPRRKGARQSTLKAISTFDATRWHPVTLSQCMETQRQWSDRAIACTTPVILALYSIVELTARQLVPRDSLMVRHAAWYAKDSPTFPTPSP
jgi:hypothetical protein